MTPYAGAVSHRAEDRGEPGSEHRAKSCNNAAATTAGDAGDIADVADPGLDRAELAARCGLPEFVVDIVTDSGLLTPVDHPEGERFAPSAVEMLNAARTLVSEGVTLEELAALAMRHATNVEDVIDDAIELFQRRASRGEVDRNELMAMLHRLSGVATDLVARHFERTLMARALARLESGSGTAAGTILVNARRLDQRIDPLSVYGAAGEHHRSLWLSPDGGVGLVALGATDSIEPSGADRFSGASAARAMLAARVRRHGPADAPAPVLIGGFSFRTGLDQRQPHWDGFSDCRLTLPEVTLIDRGDGSWVQIAMRVGPDGDESATLTEIERRLDLWDIRESPQSPASPLPLPGGDELPAVATSDAHDLSDDHYLELVAAALEGIDSGELAKVVLARKLSVGPFPGGFEVAPVLARLRVRNPACAIFAFSVGDSTFCGATPEELVILDGQKLRTVALAGSAPRSPEPVADADFSAALLGSAKDQAEHRFVVEAIVSALEALGLVDPTPAEPDIMKLSRIQHLRTPITARLRRRSGAVSDMDVLRVAGVLHPTPAVGGTPGAAALDFIDRFESFDRGWYAAPVGWCDLDGNGELRVALRCGLVCDGLLHLFAGAGIVAGSAPAEELDETSVKLAAMLDEIDAIHGRVSQARTPGL